MSTARQGCRALRGEFFMIDLPQRKIMRLKQYDYSSNGAYFITICVKNRQELLGKIVVGRGIPDAPSRFSDPVVELTKLGKNLIETIEFINKINHQLYIDKYVIMPNHVHLIIMIDDFDNGDNPNGASGGPQSVMPRPTNAIIPKTVSSIKRFTNKQTGLNIWQTSYHDHVIRDEEDYQTHLKYIEENPAKWAEDKYYGGRVSHGL
jgi:REP element-mobilizing transposase RayT